MVGRDVPWSFLALECVGGGPFLLGVEFFECIHKLFLCERIFWNLLLGLYWMEIEKLQEQGRVCFLSSKS